jgi:hypothetical protein
LDHKTIVQQYIQNPYLIEGYKWDLRVYALVTDVNPLEIYIFEEGLVRFSTQKYSLSQGTLGNKFIHLTNTSVNKQSPMLQDEKGKIGLGTKWTFR